MYKVNKTRIAKWIVALRSGKYEQTSGTLRDKTGYCCLGIGCIISKVGKWTKKNVDDKYGYVTESALSPSFSIFPEEVKDWFGLIRCDPIISQECNNASEQCMTASSANDFHNLSFEEIADKLEEYYLEGKSAEALVKKSKAAKRRKNA